MIYKHIAPVVALAVCLALASAARAETAPVIVVHGGAGALEKGLYSAAEEAAYRDKLAEALDAGYAILDRGGTALDAVEAAVVVLEDSPLFNAGKGSVFTRNGKIELDASIMDGRTRAAGAVAGLTRIKNPVRLARAVMEKSPHVMLAGGGAEEFAAEQGFELVPERYFFTDQRWKAYLDALEAENKKSEAPAERKHGTVGAVALDRNGDLAAATSTGGVLMKRHGRIGDSPIIGAGTYADNRSCGVSSTGQGEFFMRLTIARDVCAQVEYAGKSLSEAAKDVIFNRLAAEGGEGGVIALSPTGEAAMVFNAKGMFRGVRREGGAAHVEIYGEER